MIDYIKKHPALIFILLPAFLFHMLVIMPSGSSYCRDELCGMYFWGPHNHDAIWHLAVSAFSFNSYPFAMPVFAGAPLAGYNILLDMVLFVLQSAGIPAVISYFKLLPLVWFALFSVVSMTLARKIKESALFVGILLFFLFFGGSFGYMFTLFHQGTITGSANLLAVQAGQMMINLQYAFSLVIIFGILIIVKSSKHTIKDSLILGILLFLNLGLKFYGGVISLFLAGAYLMELLISKKDISTVVKHALLLAVFTGAAILVFYNPFAALSSGSVLIFSPFAIVHSLIEDPTLLYLQDQVLARYSLAEVGWSPRLLWIELYSTALYVFFNLGTRIVGFVYVFVQLFRRRLTRFDLYIGGGMIVSTALAVLFIQKGVWWNTVQFFYYAIVLSNIYAAQAVFSFIKKQKIAGTVCAVLIIILTIPTSLDLLGTYTTRHAMYISTDELAALSFLKQQDDGVVFHAFEKDPRKNYSFHSWEDTSYIPAFSGKQSYIANLVQLDLTGVDYQQRLTRVQNMDCSVFEEVGYIYFVKKMGKEYLTSCTGIISTEFEQFFQNDEVSILRKKHTFE